MKHPRPPKKDVKQRVNALPLIEGGEVIDEKTSLLILDCLAANGSDLVTHTHLQIDALYDDIIEQLSPATEALCYVVTPLQLRGIIARAAIAGIGQATHDYGQTMVEISRFKDAILIGHRSDSDDFDEPDAA